MRLRLAVLVIAFVLLAPAFVQAAEPNLRTGQWEFSNITEFKSDGLVQLPQQTYTYQQCVTVEDLGRGEALLGDQESCEVSDLKMTRDGMTYTAVCREEGADIRVDARMSFLGERMEGRATAVMNTPMGPVNMVSTVEGRRLGTCP